MAPVNIVNLPQRDEMLAAVEELRRAAPALMQAAPIIAKIRRAHFVALVAEGFTADQALDLCRDTEL